MSVSHGTESRAVVTELRFEGHFPPLGGTNNIPSKALTQGLRPRGGEGRCHRNQSMKQGLGHRNPVISWTLHQTWHNSHEPLNLWELSLRPTDAQDLVFRECVVCHVLSVGYIICKMREMGTISLPPPPPGWREKVMSVASSVNSNPH